MKLQDMSIRKKLLLSNFTMIVIPVILVLLIMYAILMGFLAGISYPPFSNEKSWSDSNYQLQLWFDSISDEIIDDGTEFFSKMIFNLPVTTWKNLADTSGFSKGKLLFIPLTKRIPLLSML